MSFQNIVDGKKRDRSSALSGYQGLQLIKVNEMVPNDQSLVQAAFTTFNGSNVGVGYQIRDVMRVIEAIEGNQGFNPITASDMNVSSWSNELQGIASSSSDTETDSEYWDITYTAPPDPASGSILFRYDGGDGVLDDRQTTTGSGTITEYKINENTLSAINSFINVLLPEITAALDETFTLDASMDLYELQGGELDPSGSSFPAQLRQAIASWLNVSSTTGGITYSSVAALWDAIIVEVETGSTITTSGRLDEWQELDSPTSQFATYQSLIDDMITRITSLRTTIRGYANLDVTWRETGSQSLKEVWRFIIKTRVEESGGTLASVEAIDDAIGQQNQTIQAADEVLNNLSIPSSERIPDPRIMAAFYLEETNIDDEVIGTSANLMFSAPAHVSFIEIYRANLSVRNYLTDGQANVEAQWSVVHAVTNDRIDDNSGSINLQWKEEIPEEQRGTFFWYRIRCVDDRSHYLSPLPSTSTTSSKVSSPFSNQTALTGMVNGSALIRNTGEATRVIFPSVEDADEEIGMRRGSYVMVDGVSGVFQIAKSQGPEIYIFPALPQAPGLNVDVFIPQGMVNAYELSS